MRVESLEFNINFIFELGILLPVSYNYLLINKVILNYYVFCYIATI